MEKDPDQTPENTADDATSRLQNPEQAERMENEHIIPNANPPKNEHQRGGFGVRMGGQQGFGTDSSDGVTSLSTNEPDSQDDMNHRRVEE